MNERVTDQYTRGHSNPGSGVDKEVEFCDKTEREAISKVWEAKWELTWESWAQGACATLRSFCLVLKVVGLWKVSEWKSGGMGFEGKSNYSVSKCRKITAPLRFGFVLFYLYLTQCALLQKEHRIWIQQHWVWMLGKQLRQIWSSMRIRICFLENIFFFILLDNQNIQLLFKSDKSLMSRKF